MMPRSLMYIGGCNRTLPYFASANAKGIACFEVDLETGAARAAGVTEGIDNPTFLAVAPDGKSLCATSEVLGWNEGVISAYAIDPSTGALSYLCKQPTRGDIAAHLAFDGTGKFVASVNYSVLPMDARPNRSLAIYPRAADGSLGPVISEAGYEGTGKDPARQERPHAHCVRWTPDNRFVVVADLGTDRLWVHAFDAASGKISIAWRSQAARWLRPAPLRFPPLQAICLQRQRAWLDGRELRLRCGQGQLRTARGGAHRPCRGARPQSLLGDQGRA